MRIAMVAAALGLVPGLTACTGGMTATAPEPSPATSRPDARPSSSPAASSGGPSPEGIAAECDVAPCEGSAGTSHVDRASSTYFRLPSDNITCSLSELAATCEIHERSFASPPRPTDCDLDHGNMVSVTPAGPASFLCHGDTAFVQATPFHPDSPLVGYGDALPYGDQITNGVFVCSSSRRGVACSTAAGDHGFTLSRAEYRTY